MTEDFSVEWKRKVASRVARDAQARWQETKLRQMQHQLASMTHPTTPFKTGAARRTLAFKKLPLSHEAKVGFEIARSRGLCLLIEAYRTRLQEYGEQNCRVEDTDQGLNLQTGEGVNQERKYEPLRLSPVLLRILKDNMTTSASASYVSCLGNPHVQDILWTALEKIEATFLRSQDANDVVQNDLELTQHETVIGAVICLLKQSGRSALMWRYTKKVRFTAKCVDLVSDAHLLRIFAVASFVEMVEGLHNMYVVICSPLEHP